MSTSECGLGTNAGNEFTRFESGCFRSVHVRGLGLLRSLQKAASAYLFVVDVDVDFQDGNDDVDGDDGDDDAWSCGW